MYQDWKVVKLKKSKGPGIGKGPAKADKVLMHAAKTGEEVEAVRKVSGGNKKTGFIPGMARKVDSEEIMTVSTVGYDTSQGIQQARVKKGWTQAQLAKEINEKVTLVEAYENGTAKVDNRILSLMEKALGAKIPRPPKKKKEKKKKPSPYIGDDDW